jgi:hypothetical protein
MPHLELFFARYKEVKKAWSQRNPQHWWIGPLDEVILDACASKPDHNDVCHVYAKVALVSRMYKAKLIMAGADAEWKVAMAFVKKGADSIVNRLHRLAEFNRRTVPQIVRCHGKLVDLVMQATGKRANVFCSKYLSFHFPEIVPILDHKSSQEAEKLVATARLQRLRNRTVDEEYAMHCARILYLCEWLQKHGIKRPELKAIDYILYTANEPTIWTSMNARSISRS